MQIVNVKCGKCLSRAGASYFDSHFELHECFEYTAPEQFFYMRSKGKPKGHGRLRIKGFSLCIEVKSDKMRARNWETNSTWTTVMHTRRLSSSRYTKSGELVNPASRTCVVTKHDTGQSNMRIWGCDNERNQVYTRSHCKGDYCSFSNQPGYCIGSRLKVKRAALVFAGFCFREWASSKTEKWAKPKVDWKKVACSESRKVTQTVRNTVDFSSTVDKTVGIEIAATIEAGVSYEDASTSFSSTISRFWSEGNSDTKGISTSCDNYGDGKPFKKGCMWQLQMKTKKESDNKELSWKPQIIRCTRSTTPPKCPPFTKCKDEKCAKCEDNAQKGHAAKGSLMDFVKKWTRNCQSLFCTHSNANTVLYCWSFSA